MKVKTMDYRTILVSLNNYDQTAKVLDHAVAIAKKYDAHLIGLHVLPKINIQPFAVPVDIPQEVLEAQKKAFQEEADRVKAHFNEVTGRESISTEWRGVVDQKTSIATRTVENAHYADLIVTGQGKPEGPDEMAELCERLIMEAGRPIYLVPRETKVNQAGDVILLAWNASRESARAAFDALPFLHNSRQVNIVWIEPEDSAGQSLDLGGSEIATTLARHGVQAEITWPTEKTGGIGLSLNEQVARSGADLVVMGGYGHSRFREYIFGGATRHMLANMSVPILISH